MYVPATQAAQLEEDECPEAVVTVDAMTDPLAQVTHTVALAALHVPEEHIVQAAFADPDE